VGRIVVVVVTATQHRHYLSIRVLDFLHTMTTELTYGWSMFERVRRPQWV